MSEKGARRPSPGDVLVGFGFLVIGCGAAVAMTPASRALTESTPVVVAVFLPSRERELALVAEYERADADDQGLLKPQEA